MLFKTVSGYSTTQRRIDSRVSWNAFDEGRVCYFCRKTTLGSSRIVRKISDRLKETSIGVLFFIRNYHNLKIPLSSKSALETVEPFLIYFNILRPLDYCSQLRQDSPSNLFKIHFVMPFKILPNKDNFIARIVDEFSVN